MKIERLAELGLMPTNSATSEMFIMDIPNYKLTGLDEGVEGYIAQYDFRHAEDLRGKDLWCLLLRKRIDGKKISTTYHVSNDFMNDISPQNWDNVVREFIEESLIIEE